MSVCGLSVPGIVWPYDFLQDRTQDGDSFRMPPVIDMVTRRTFFG